MFARRIMYAGSAVLLALGLGLCAQGCRGRATRGLGGVTDGSGGLHHSGRNWALLIGINRYRQWPSLRYPVPDVRLFKDIIPRRYQFRPEHIRTVENEAATKGGINAALESFLGSEVRKDDTLLIYYSGHGYSNPSTKLGYWIPHDAGGNTTTRTNWLTNAEVRGVIRRVKCRHVLLISDSCFSGDILDSTRGSGSDLEVAWLRSLGPIRLGANGSHVLPDLPPEDEAAP